jgi:hypothetical protein
VTIDCPRDCAHLVASRAYDRARKHVDWSELPFAEVEIKRSFLEKHSHLLATIDYAIGEFSVRHRDLVDTDVQAALQTLAESYRTLASGVIYEKPLDNPLHRGLYQWLKAAITDFRQEEARRVGMTTLRDSDVRDALILLTRQCALFGNGRPKGRAYLDMIRSQFPEEAFQKRTSNIVLPY